MATKRTADINLVQLIDEFGSEQKCRAYLEGIRWPESIRCLRCKSPMISRVSTRERLNCDSCGYQFSVTVDTIFHSTHLPLWKWFLATYIMIESKKGVSANQLKRMLNVSYKTAWYLCHRIRAAMKDASAELLAGVVEVDETWVGDKAKNMHKVDRERRVGGSGHRDHMTLVLGAVERGGGIRLKVDHRADSKTLRNFIRTVVDGDVEAIMTDEWHGYHGIEDEDTRHEVVRHRSDEWVRGDVHTNTVEGVWSLFKRSIVGSYHQLSAKHMQSYLDEMAFRYDNRENPYLFRDTIVKLIEADYLQYKTLVADA